MSAGRRIGRLRKAASLRRGFRRLTQSLTPLAPVAGVMVVSYLYLGLVSFVYVGRPETSVSEYLRRHSLCVAGADLQLDTALKFRLNSSLWLFLMNLSVIANLLVIGVSFYLVWQSMSGKQLGEHVVRPYPRRTGVIAVLAVLVCCIGLPAALWAAASPRLLMPQMTDLLDCTVAAYLPSATRAMYSAQVLSISAVFCLAAASCAIIWPPRRGRQGAQELARRMGHLRLLLYVGTLSLIIGVLRASATLRFAFSHLPAALGKDAAGLDVARTVEGVSSAMVSGQALFNSFILAAFYIPAFLILRRRATALAGRRMPPPEREEWLRSRGLSVSFSEYLPGVAAILGPLLAGPTSELLGRLAK